MTDAPFTPDPQLAIQTSGLSKSFDGDNVAVDRLDLEIQRGAFYGLLGRNGAGKTTLMRLLMGLYQPSRGDSAVLGQTMAKASPEHRARVAYVSQSHALHPRLSAEELAYFVSHFYPSWDGDFAQQLMRRFDLPGQIAWSKLSGGEQRKVGIVLALAARPEVLILDEPAAGLDPVSRRELMSELIDLLLEVDGSTILLSTHILSDLERPADTIGILDHGRLLLSAPMESLQSGARRVQAVFEGNVPAALAQVPGPWRTQIDGRVLTAWIDLDSQDDHPYLQQLRQAGATVDAYPVDLEDLFIGLVSRDRDDESGRLAS